MVGRANHDDEVERLRQIHFFGSDDRANLPFNANSHERFTVGLPDGDANPKNGIGTFFAEYGEVGRLDPGAGMDDSIEFPMGFDCIFLFHGAKIPKKLSSEAFAAFGTAAGEDIASTMGRHSSAEASAVSVLHFRGLVGFFACHNEVLLCLKASAIIGG